MKLKKFKEKDNKRIGIIVFTVACILLVSGVILYRTFAIFEVKTNQNVIKGTVQDPGNLYFAFYQKNEESGEYVIQKDMPDLEKGYVLDEVQSYCGVNGEEDTSIEVYLSEDGYIKVKGMKQSRTKCNLYFAKGKFIQGKGIPIVEDGDGLYEVPHSEEETSGIDPGWQETEYRYAGSVPNNYVSFNNELWRIIGFVNVKVTKEDGSEGIEQRLKMIRNYKLEENKAWDENDENDWTKASLMTYLNTTYYNDLQTKDMIDQNIIWNIGGSKNGYTTNSNGLTAHWYSYERGTNTYNGQPFEWKKENEKTFQSIGLLYVSDYGYATSGGAKGRTKCFAKELLSWSEEDYQSECAANDWLKPSNFWRWSLSSDASWPYVVISISSDGKVNGYHSNGICEILPVVYLSSNIQIVSGTGTFEDAFQLEIK